MDKYDYNFLYNLLNLTSKPFEPDGETFKPDLCFYQFWYVDHEHKYFSWRFCIREYVDFKVQSMKFALTRNFNYLYASMKISSFELEVDLLENANSPGKMLMTEAYRNW